MYPSSLAVQPPPILCELANKDIVKFPLISDSVGFFFFFFSIWLDQNL